MSLQRKLGLSAVLAIVVGDMIVSVFFSPPENSPALQARSGRSISSGDYVA
jgi:hypothetical protein